MTGPQSLLETDSPVIKFFKYFYKSSFIEPFARINNLWQLPLP